MKNLAFTTLLLIICIFSKSQNSNKELIGKWVSIDGKNIVLAFTSSIERKYYLRKDVKKVPTYNIEEARISVNGNLLSERESGGGGIDVTRKFEISNDTLMIYYQKNTIKYSFKKISDKEFRLLTGRKL